MSQKTWSVIFVTSILIFGATFVFISPYSPLPPLRTHAIQIKMTTQGAVVDLHAEVLYWKKRINAVGGISAFAELADSVKELSLGIQHVVAHAFGQALYEAKGIDGFPGCGTVFGQGCFHQFFGLAVREQGIEDAPKSIEALCAAGKEEIDKINCEHGLGHGIMGYLGYTMDDLARALAVCRDVVPRARLDLGCRGGAFMEYNFRSLIGADAGVETRIRPLTHESMYAPCDAVPETDKISCMFWQPWWWHVNLIGTVDSETLFRRLGDHCKDASGAGLSDACFQGIGYMIPNREKSDLGVAARLCAAATDSGLNRILCWSYAVPLIAPATPDYEGALCGGLAPKEHSYCVQHFGDDIDIF